MKSDKSGACAVLGIFKAVGELKPYITVHGVIAACENMPDGKSYRPDDIIKARNGVTIEVGNTDAEGRLTLADALSYVSELKPDAIIDMATLTGACIVALGEYTAGVMGNNQKFIDEILDISERTGEWMWQLPFNDKLREHEAPVKVPKEFQELEDIEKFAKEHSMEIKKSDKYCEIYSKLKDYLARYEKHE